MINHFPRSHLQLWSHWGLGFQHLNTGDTLTQPIAITKAEVFLTPQTHTVTPHLHPAPHEWPSISSKDKFCSFFKMTGKVQATFKRALSSLYSFTLMFLSLSGKSPGMSSFCSSPQPRGLAPFLSLADSPKAPLSIFFVYAPQVFC